MKKILLALTAAVSCAFLAKADGIYNFMGFESLTAGNVLDANKDDANDQTGDAYWTYTANSGTTECIVSNYDGNAYNLYGVGNESLAQGAPGNNYLVVEASEAKLFRNVNPKGVGASDQFGAAQDIDTGLYFDSLVQFSATDQSPELEGQDKLVVWLYGGDEDSTLYGAATNLVVTAAFLKDAFNTVVSNNYVVSVEGVTVMPGEWHRLTIKALNEIADSNAGFTDPVPGFVVFIDGKVASCADAKGVEGSAMDAAKLNATALAWNNKNALFPSLATGKAAAQQITAVGFDGSGAIDDVCFTTTAPTFAADGMFFTLNWSIGVQSMTINGDAVAVDPTAAGSTNIAVATSGATYTVEVTAAAGYSVPTEYGFSDGVSAVGTTFTVTSTGTGTITMVPAFFMIGNTPYASFAAALEAAQDGDTVKVAADVAFESGTVVSLSGSKDIVLDLAGHKISTADEENETVVVGSGRTLTVVDSVGGGEISNSGDGEAIYNEGTIIWGSAEETDKGAKLIGELGGNNSVVRGLFNAGDNTDGGEFAGTLAEGSNAELVDGFWVVTPGEPVQKLTIVGNENADYTVTINGEPAASGAVIEAGNVIVITVTPKTNYEYATTPEGWTAGDGVITKTITVVGNASVSETIPAPTSTEPPAPTTYTLTVTPASNASYAAVDSNNVAIAFTENVATIDAGAAVTITATAAEGYTYQGVDLTETEWTYDNVNDVITRMIEAMSADVVEAVPAPRQEETPPVSEYPTYISGIEDAEVKAAYQTKYNTWKTTYGADTESAYEAAFLLNIAPDAADKTLKPVSITVGADGVAIAANQALASVNGKVYVKTATTLAGLSTAEWVEATLDEGVIKVTPGASDTAGFYKIKVDF